ncbi:MAG TPA: hypothetical protein VNV66_15945 [Pilimelia sp.]|nr:hypothetical protein [Pilimelia sp.]
MVRIPSSARRSDSAAVTDRDGDGRVDAHDGRPAADHPGAPHPASGSGPAAVREQVDDRGTYRSRSAGAAPAEAGRHAEPDPQAAPGSGPEAGPGRHADRATDRTVQLDRVDSADHQARTDRAATERAADRATTEQAEAHRLADGRPRGRAAVVEPETADRSAGEPEAGVRPRASLLATLGLVVGLVAALAVLTGTLAGYGLGVGLLGLFLSVAGLSATRRRHIAGKADALLGVLLSLGALVVGGLALFGVLPALSPETNTVDTVRQWLDTQFSTRF